MLGKPCLKSRPWIKLAESPPENYRSAYISKNQEGWWASFYVQKEEIPFIDNGKVLAADMGIKQFMTATSNENRVFMSGSISKMTKHYNRKLDKIRSKRDLKKKNSNRYRKLTETYRRISKKKKNKIQDFLHKLSHKLTVKFVENTIVVGDLRPAKWKKSKNKKLNRSVQNNWFVSRFYGMMEYKCKLYGKRFVKINEAYTSKTCSSCGLIHDMPLWRRQMECSCGFSEDRDVNSAINILKRFYAQDTLTPQFS
jgi:putative transposase